MEFTNPNQFEKIRRLEGLNNQNDIWDPETFADLNTETFNDIVKTIEILLPNVKEFISKGELTAETSKCLEKVQTFCNELSIEFKQTFLSLLEQYKQEHCQMSQKIINYLLEKDFFLPLFTISNGKQAQKLLEEYGLGGDIDEQNLLLTFQLPKPLAQFWWKGGAHSWGNMSEDIKHQAIEWGHFYRELMPVIWEAQGRHENENGLDFQRINEVGEHEPQKFYYVWEVSKWKD